MNSLEPQAFRAGKGVHCDSKGLCDQGMCRPWLLGSWCTKEHQQMKQQTQAQPSDWDGINLQQ